MAAHAPPRPLVLLLVLLAAIASAVYPDDPWDDRIDPACCAYPEHDPRDYNWPYSHFQYSEIIPDVVGSFVSMCSLNLTYAANAKSKDDSSGVEVEYGKPLPPSRIARAPAVAFALYPDRSARTLHTLLMVDPDAPFRDTPSDGEWVHWLVYDIPGNDTSKGTTLVEYAPPAPKPCPKKDRLCLKEHRVTFILWEQPHGMLQLQSEDVRIKAGSSAGRARFKARDFAARHRLGLHLAMNFFETYHDEGKGTFDAQPWWHVRDTESLAKVSHLVPHVEHEAERDEEKDEL